MLHSLYDHFGYAAMWIPLAQMCTRGQSFFPPHAAAPLSPVAERTGGYPCAPVGLLISLTPCPPPRCGLRRLTYACGRTRVAGAQRISPACDEARAGLKSCYAPEL